MKIAYISAGAAGMFCGSCLHDNTLAAALHAKGHDVSLVPTYTPMRTDEDDVSIDRIFYGAVNVYLEQKSALFRHTPWLFDRLLNSPRLLDWAARHGASVDPTDLGALTLSVLQGEGGNQSKELKRLVEWLTELAPDVVHLTNSLFVGMGHRIREAVGVPVLCSVQGEDLYLDSMSEPFRSRVRETLREKAADIDAFIATNRYYVQHMSDYLGVAPERMHQVNLGVSLGGYDPPAEKAPRPFTIGYLARICPEKGLHLLVEAFHRLAERAGPEQVRLRIAGYLGQRDRDYFEGIMGQVRSWGLERSVDHVGEVGREQKIEFLRSLHLLSVPTIYHESKGLYVLEALAAGTPVVEPSHGTFPELIEATGGGVLVEPESAAALTDALETLMNDPERCDVMGRRGRQVVHRDYSAEVMAEATLQVYRRYVDGRMTGA